MACVFALHVPFIVQYPTDDSIVDMKYGCSLFTFNGIIMPVYVRKYVYRFST